MTDGSTSAPAGDLRLRQQGRAVSEDMRRHAVAAVLHEGMSRQAAARRFGVSASSVALWVRRYRERGDLRPDKPGGSASRIEPERGRILRILAARPNLTMYELRDALAAEGVSFHPATVQRFLERHGLDLKSRRAARALRRSRQRAR